ncbi:MAG: sulfatase [Verrucomicrobia bacterium]|nr:sulfatase [Verrucomicrobiota bacterium]
MQNRTRTGFASLIGLGISALVFSVGLLLVPNLAHAAEKPNVLFIAVDDMNHDLGTFGHPLVKSPNIDRLAKSGVQFDRAYCQFPLCAPSRASVMTGLRPDTVQVFDLTTTFRKALPDQVSLSQLFINNGYYAARVGKIYHYQVPGDIGKDGLDDRKSWNHKVNPIGRDRADKKLVTNLTPGRTLGIGLDYLRSEAADEELTDGKVATETIKLLEANKDKPFFIAAGFYLPHLPFIAPKKYFDLYPIEKVQVPKGPFDYMKDLPVGVMSMRPWPWMGVTETQARDAVQGYWASISYVDAQIGRLLDAVERLGLAKNTIIVFWSDHGYHTGEHGLLKKQSLFENSARSPLIIAHPGAKNKGKSTRRIVEFIDIYPTLAELASLTPPKNLEGKSLKPLLDNPTAKWDRPAFTQVWRASYPGHSVRTDRYRYTEWDNGKQGAQLYDYTTDPEEKRNLINDPKHAKVVSELRDLVRKNWANEYRPIVKTALNE